MQLPLLLTLLPLAALMTPAVVAQKAQVAPHMVDGISRPDLISQDEVFKMLFLQVADGNVNWTLQDRLAYLSPSGLSAEERGLVIDSGNKYRIALNSCARSVKKLPMPKDHARIRQLADELDRTQRDIMKSLEDDLGPTPYRKLLAFVNTKVRSETFKGIDKP